MELFETMEKRRSVRKYTEENIPGEILDKILKAGLMAPSSRGLMPCELVLVTEKEMLEKLSEIKTHGGSMLKNAAAAIMVLGDSEKADTWIEDTSIAMTYMHLAATALGVGSCWVQARLRGTDEASAEENVRKLMDIPENMKLEALLALGMAETQPKPIDVESICFDKIHYGKY